MTTQLLVTGIEETPAQDADAALRQPFDLRITPRASVQIGATQRGQAQEVPLTAEDDDLVELEYSDGGREWMRVDALRRRLGQAAQTRGIETALRVPLTPPGVAPAATRGAGEALLKRLTLFALDRDGFANQTAADIIQLFDAKLDPKPGLYGIDLAGKLGPLVEQPLAATDQPLLILLHGTFSSILGSFTSLFGTYEWEQLGQIYGDRIYALEHRTLSQSPLDNALALVKVLPDGAKLHLVSHSRGGLIGELLVLQELTDDDRRAFRLAGREGQLAVLEELLALVTQKGLRVERFVRVACPANGTLLVADNFDRFLSVILNLVGWLGDGATGGALDPLIAYVKATILTLIQKRADPATLPGLEAMIPGSPLVRLLNLSGHTSPTDLAVIAGDTERGLRSWPSLAAIVAEFIFAEDHDLVVNTGAMSRGIARRKGVFVFAEQSPQTHHFNYFHNQTTRSRIYAWLKHGGDAEVDGFQKVLEPPTPAARSRGEAPALSPTAPVVILIPGLLATQLKAGERPLWLDMAALASGRIDQLALTKELENAVTPDVIFPAVYQPLQEALAKECHVIPFPYDWRKSVREAAEQLAALVEEALKTPGRPVHLVAHSTGGLVAHALLAYAPATWTKLCNRGGRLVMLGTPHRGTYAALDLLSGQAALVQMLALLDPTHPVDKLCALFWGFPGLVELLPQETEAWLSIWATAETNKLRSKAQVQAALKKAQRVWETLAQAVDPMHMRQVLGSAPWTPNGIQVDAANRLLFQGTGDGDGVVTTQQGQLPGVPTWYVNAPHAELCKAADLFPALLELLKTGQTTQLSQTPPVQVQRGADPLRAFKLVGFPNAAELTAAALGGVLQPTLPAARGPATVLQVSVAHASLEYTTLPVAVGHYHSDLITGPEAALDWRLDGKLSKRRAMRIYPGRVGEAEVILLPSNTPPGALVIGLGEIGELTADIVTRGITEAALRLALIRYETATKAPAKEGASTADATTPPTPPQRLSAAFSALLIGVRGGRPLTIENSVAAIVTGALQANRILADQKLVGQVCIDKIEFIEIYEEYAIRAAHAVRNLKQYLRLPLVADEDLALAQHLQRGEGGFVGQPANEYEEGWWRRLQISEKKDAEGKGTGELEFVLLTDRARAELTLQATQRALVGQLVAQAINQRDAASDLTLPATLYELLLPNNLKNQPLDTSDLLLIVDPLSAQYPWEMLADRRPGEQTITSSQQLRPLSVRRGIVRQLTTGAYRTLVQPARGDKALVIGEPRLDPVRYPDEANYPSLPGARAEAKAVADLLEERGYKVTRLIQADALTIIKALFADDYQIIHIAGHGNYNPTAPAQSGVLLGGELFLTAAEIGQLRVVPEMVFLNCCYLGQIDATPKPPDALQQTQRAWNQLAASISQELIKIRVRAVVAAGWAVNDAAAQAFAEQLYGLMLPVRAKVAQGNLPFGEAVGMARSYIYDKVNNPPNNTWGAYQCYGDPGFMLNPMARTVRRPEAKYVSPSEMLRELRNLQSRASRIGDQNRLATLQQTVQTLEAHLPARWRDGEMLYAFGETYAELADFPQAITHYRDAMKASSPNERVPIRAIEQLANLEARYAQELLSAAPRSGPEPLQDAAWTPIELLKQAEKRLNNLNELAPTPERQALLGSCYKRLAMLANGADRRKLLQDAATCYQEAAKLAKAAGKAEFYHVLNEVTCQFLSEETRDETIRQTWLAALASDETTQANGTELDFWKRVASADRDLASALIRGTIVANAAAIQKLYSEAFNVGATARQQATVIAHIEFVSAMLEGRDDKAATVLRQMYKTLIG